jgi:nucleotide-binding universal stress UspA family protein
MRNFKPSRILVPMDFSKQSFNALDTAITMAQQQHASLTLIQAINHAKVIIPPKQEAVLMPIEQLSKLANENLNVLAKSLSSKHGIDVRYDVVAGVPVDVICGYAKEKIIDLIVIGTKGVFGLRRMFTETTAYKVLKRSPCPVLSVPAIRLFTHFKKVVFPVRNAPHMLDKYEFVRPILDTNDSFLLITGLTKVNDVGSFKRVTTIIDALRHKLVYDRVAHSSKVHFCDSISSSLLEVSDQEKPDLIVIMAFIDNTLKRFFLEYYAKSIVSSANCAVLSIRPDMVIVN